MVGVGYHVAVLIHHRHGDEAQVIAIRSNPLSVGSENQGMRFSGRSDDLFICFPAISVVGDDLDLTRLVFHLIPAEAIPVEA